MVAQGREVPAHLVAEARARMQTPFMIDDIRKIFINGGFPFYHTASELLLARERRAGRIARAGKGWVPHG